MELDQELRTQWAQEARPTGPRGEAPGRLSSRSEGKAQTKAFIVVRREAWQTQGQQLDAGQSEQHHQAPG